MCHAAVAEEIGALAIGELIPAFEGPLGNALSEDALAYSRKHGQAASLDSGATALQRGDWLRAHAEASKAAESKEEEQAARGKARLAWLLARFGLPHLAINLANDALPVEAARGEVLLARAWILWQVGAFASADHNAALAARAVRPAPAWALAEWKRLRTERAVKAAAFAGAEEPFDEASSEFLEHAERALAAGAYNQAAGLFTRSFERLQSQSSSETPSASFERALSGLRNCVLGAMGGRLPGTDFANTRAVALLMAQQVATLSRQRITWESYFKLAADIMADRGDFDFARVDLAGDLATAEQRVGLGQEWRARFRPLLEEARLRYASRLRQAVLRAEADPAFSINPQVEDAKRLAAFAETLAHEEAALKNLSAAVPAGAPPVPLEKEFAQMVGITRLRLALARRDRNEARAQFALLSNGAPSFDAGTYRSAIDALGSDELAEILKNLAQYTLDKVPPDALARAVVCAAREEETLRKKLGTHANNPENMQAEDLRLSARIQEVQILAAACEGRILAAESALEALERWCKHLPDYAGLESSQVAVLAMQPKIEAYTPEEQAIAEAIQSGQPKEAYAKQLGTLAFQNFNRLAPRLLLLRLHWALCQDYEAAKAMQELRSRARVNEVLPEQLDALMAQHDTKAICNNLVAKLRVASPENRAAVAIEVERHLGELLDRYHRRYNNGDSNPIPKEKNIGMAIFPYRHILAALGCTQAAQGKIRSPIDLLKIVSQDSEKMLRDYVVVAPFRNDLPDEVTVRAWRELLQDKPLSVPVLMAIQKGLMPHYDRSLTADLAHVLLRYRNGDYATAKSILKKLRDTYGINNAYAAQIGLIESLIDARTRVTLLFGSNMTVDRELEQARGELDRYVNAHRETLQEVYSRDASSAETKAVDAMEARIAELKARGYANVLADQDQLNQAAKERIDAQTRAFSALLRMTL